MFLHDEKQARVQSILTDTGLDFEIFKKPMTTMFNDKVIDTPYFALINGSTNEVINSVKKGYTISQNREIVELVVEGMSKFGSKLSVSKGGSLDGGKKVFLQLAIEGDSRVGNDTIKRYVTIIDSNDGSSSLSIGIGDLTMSCSNQFFKFYKAGQSRFRHTATIDQRMKEIPMLIEMALSQSLKMIETYQAFVSTPCSRELAHQLVNRLLGFDKATMTHKEYSELSSRNENAMNCLYNNIEHEMNDKGNNIWGLHSGVTRWTTHDKSAPTRLNGRVEGIMLGTNYRVNQASLEFALEQL